MPNPLSKRVLQSVRQRLSRTAGLEPPDWVLEARIKERVKTLGLSATENYLEALARDAEVHALVELLRVGETRFFRHKGHVTALAENVVPALKAGRGPLRAWSAGCATGEEAYTLALLLTEGFASSGRAIEVVASDISSAAIERAKRGEYPAHAIENVPARMRMRAFEKLSDSQVRVRPDIRKLVTFEQRNLARRPYPRDFDLILCRNVLIYFTPEAKLEAQRALVESLRPGGFLFVGYSETLRDVAGLEPYSADDARLYRRSANPRHKTASVPVPFRPVAAAVPSATAALPRRQRGKTQPSSPPPVPPPPTAKRRPLSANLLQLRGDYQDSERLSQEISAALQRANGALTIDLDGAEYLGSDAAAILRRALATAEGLNVELRLLAETPGPTRFLRRHGLLREDHE
jgi:chemotaxis protein methyltransferase CheR